MASFIEIEGLSGVWAREITRYPDNRGFFSEEFRMSESPVPIPNFVQDSLSFSRENVLRGLHLQIGQWQLVTLLGGALQDVLIDISPTSPTFKQTISLKLSEEGLNQLLLGPGIAHGYGVISDESLIHYKSTVYYGESPQFGVHWSSMELQHHWPKNSWVISDRDAQFPILQDLLKDQSFIEAITLNE